MTVIARYKDLRVYEWDSGYEIEHTPTGLRHWMSDGVDMFEGVKPGTFEFNGCMFDWLKADTSELMEAYFPQLLEPTTHYIAMGGMHGCLPNFCDVFKDRETA